MNLSAGVEGGTVEAWQAHRSAAYRIYLVLATAYVASQFFRVSNAVIAPELMQSLALTPTEMGAITGAFFLAFAVAQLPAGVLLDRFGPRYTMSGLFLLAILGSLVFAYAKGMVGLTFGRTLMGVGCAAGLMGALVAIARWFPEDRFASLSAALFTIGGVGTLLATTPLAALSAVIGWRGAFLSMAALTGLLALLLYAVVRDGPPARPLPVGARERPAEIWQGLKAVLGNRQLWCICAIQFVNYGTLLAVAGLWGGPYLNDVHGLDGLARGNVLLALNVAILVGVMAYGGVDRLLNSRKSVITGGALLTAAVLAVLAALPSLALWQASGLLILFGVVGSYVMLVHAHARAILPDHLVGARTDSAEPRCLSRRFRPPVCHRCDRRGRGSSRWPRARGGLPGGLRLSRDADAGRAGSLLADSRCQAKRFRAFMKTSDRQLWAPLKILLFRASSI